MERNKHLLKSKVADVRARVQLKVGADSLAQWWINFERQLYVQVLSIKYAYKAKFYELPITKTTIAIENSK